MVTNTKRAHPFGKDFINSKALRKFRQDNNLSNVEIAERIGMGVRPGTISKWIRTNRIPRELPKILGFRTREVTTTRKASATPVGDLYVVYITDKTKQPFLAFCNSLGIDHKSVL